MPTLIRLIVILLVLVGLGYGAMVALVAFVQPREKEVTVRIPTRELVPSPDRDPLVRREINTTRQPEAEAAPVPEPAPIPTPAVAPAATPEPAGEDGEVRTLSPGIE